MTRPPSCKFAIHVILALSMAVLAAPPASAQSREQLEKWAQVLTDIRGGACKEEDKKAVVGKIDYAIMLIGHSEVEEAESSLATALASAQGASCKQAVEASGKLSKIK